MSKGWAVLGAMLIAGCNSAKSAPDAGADAGHCPLPADVTSANFAEAFATASVCASVGCAPIADGVLPRAMRTALARWQASAVAESIAAGTLHVDYSQAASCLVAVADGCRVQSLKLPGECRGVLIPQQPQGASCYTHYDCLDGYCIGDSYPGCAGTCSANDGGCSEPTDCGQFQTCVAGRCVEGATAGSDCAEDSDCQVGLGCVGKKCVVPGGAGESCESDGHCLSGFYCAEKVCTAARGVGKPCSQKESSLACGYGSYCEILSVSSPTCTAYGGPGTLCSAFEAAFGTPTCEVGLVCVDGGSIPDASVTRCLEPPSSGPCADLIIHLACDVGDYCGEGDAGCLAFQPDGQSCDLLDKTFFGCTSGVCGDAGKCVAPGAYCPVIPPG